MHAQRPGEAGFERQPGRRRDVVDRVRPGAPRAANVVVVAATAAGAVLAAGPRLVAGTPLERCRIGRRRCCRRAVADAAAGIGFAKRAAAIRLVELKLDIVRRVELQRQGGAGCEFQIRRRACGRRGVRRRHRRCAGTDLPQPHRRRDARKRFLINLEYCLSFVFRVGHLDNHRTRNTFARTAVVPVGLHDGGQYGWMCGQRRVMIRICFDSTLVEMDTFPPTTLLCHCYFAYDRLVAVLNKQWREEVYACRCIYMHVKNGSYPKFRHRTFGDHVHESLYRLAQVDVCAFPEMHFDTVRFCISD